MQAFSSKLQEVSHVARMLLTYHCLLAPSCLTALSEQSRATALAEKLQELCRTLQQDNKRQLEEEQSKRQAQSQHLQDMISVGVQVKLASAVMKALHVVSPAVQCLKTQLTVTHGCFVQNVQSQINQHSDIYKKAGEENARLMEENTTLREKLTTITELVAITEKRYEQILTAKSLELQLAEAKLEQQVGMGRRWLLLGASS